MEHKELIYKADARRAILKVNPQMVWCLEGLGCVDAVEVVHSWWEKSTEGYKICHHCKADVAIFSGHKNYCPNCGAKMDGGNEDG